MLLHLSDTASNVDNFLKQTTNTKTSRKKPSQGDVVREAATAATAVKVAETATAANLGG